MRVRLLLSLVRDEMLEQYKQTGRQLHRQVRELVRAGMEWPSLPATHGLCQHVLKCAVAMP